MVDPNWPTHPLYLFFQGLGLEKGIGFLIEHGHRLAGWTVGACVIVLAVGLWLTGRRSWIRWLGLAALAGVCIQGVLGGLRVRLDTSAGSELALVHGCFGQLVFALLVSVAICTSRHWVDTVTPVAAPGVATALTVLLVLQLILGAFIRHKESALAQRGHFLTAFAITFAVAWLVKITWDQQSADRNLAVAVRFLAVLLGCQLMLGVEAWFVRFAGGPVVEPGHWLFNRDLVRSAHVLVGSLLLATSVVITLQTQRLSRAGFASAPGVPAGRLGEAV
jgi:heme A synthase